MIQPTAHPYFRLPTQDEAKAMGIEKLSEISINSVGDNYSLLVSS